MSKSNRKSILLQGASTLLLATGSFGIAQAQEASVDLTAAAASGTVVTADSVAGSNQGITGSVEADVTSTATSVSAGNTTNGSLTLDLTNTGASAVGNTDTLTFTDADAVTNSTSVALTARQTSTGTDPSSSGALITVDADTTSTSTTMSLGTTTGGAYAVQNNTDTATATGNTVTQSAALNSTTLTLGTASGTADTAGSAIAADGDAVVASLQTNTFSTTSATNSASTVALSGGATSGAELSLSGNNQAATGTGSTATNSLQLSGVTVGTGGLVVSDQINDAKSTVSAATVAAGGLQISGAATDANLALTGNTQQSRATGGTVANTLSVDASSITLPSADTVAAAVLGASSGTISGAYGTLNTQSVSGDVTATTTAKAGSDNYTQSVTGAVTDSSLAADTNTLLARAQGAVATNTTTLAVGTLDAGTAATGGISNAATIGNVQSLAADVDVTAKIDTAGKEAMATVLGGAVSGSQVSSSGNKVQAFADGAVATSSMTVTGTSIDVGAAAAGVPQTKYDGTSATANAAFSVANSQTAGNGTVSASLTDTNSTLATVIAETSGAVSGSEYSLNGNGIDAFATSNKATNALSLDATSLTGDAGVVNAQNSAAQVSSTIGATADQAGVLATFDDDVSGSSIDVNRNVVRGSSIGNVGNNTLTVAATSLDGDGTSVKATASGTSAGNVTAAGDFSLANAQVLSATSSTTTQVFGVFGASQTADASGAVNSLTNSQVSVSGNVQFGEALGNTATNRVTIAATDTGAGTDPTAALSSAQSANTDVDATSEMTAYATAASSGSSIALNGNNNTALGAINNANNAMTVSGVSLGGNEAVGTVTSNTSTLADYALNNLQSATGDLDSTATSLVYNYDRTATGNEGLSNSKVALNSNVTTAEASSNRAANQLTVSATSNDVTAGLGNSQSNGASVSASATTTVEFAMLTDSGTTAASGSDVEVLGNTTTALARGNTANNALNYTVGASYTAPTTAVALDGTSTAAATAVVLNAQTNTGAVDAQSLSATYKLELNGGGAGMSGSSGTLGGNATNAVAYGNSAVNSLTMATFGAGVPSSGISSMQSNSGAVTAAATSVAFNMSQSGTASGSILRNTGNTVTAQAVGNSSVSSIGGGS